jgi:hypothetical protein
MLGDCGSKIHVLFLEKLFLFYGPNLIYNSASFFEKFSEKSNTEEFINCVYIFMTAALAAGSSFNDFHYGKIFALTMDGLLRHYTNALYEKPLWDMNLLLRYGLYKMSYKRMMKFWDWIIELSSRLETSDLYLLNRISSLVVNISSGFYPKYFEPTLQRLLEYDIGSVRSSEYYFYH